jgi:hypothetical protein
MDISFRLSWNFKPTNWAENRHADDKKTQLGLNEQSIKYVNMSNMASQVKY